MGELKNRYRSFRLLLLILFVGYLAAVNLFTHSHVINGVTIVHSHPFSKKADHTHTSVEFELIHLLAHYDSLDITLLPVFLIVAFNLLAVLEAPRDSRNHFSWVVKWQRLRAPPQFSI